MNTQSPLARRSMFIAAAAVPSLLVLAFVSFPTAAQHASTTSSIAPTGLSGHTIRGDLTVELRLMPQSGYQADWAAPIKNVDEVTMLEDWVVLRKRDGTTRGMLIVPRDQIGYINVGE